MKQKFKMFQGSYWFESGMSSGVYFFGFKFMTAVSRAVSMQHLQNIAQQIGQALERNRNHFVTLVTFIPSVLEMLRGMGIGFVSLSSE